MEATASGVRMDVDQITLMVERVAQIAGGAPVRPEQTLAALAALDYGQDETDEGWTEFVSQLLARHELRVTPVQASGTELLSSVGRQQPAIVRAAKPGSGGDFYIVSERRGARVLVEGTFEPEAGMQSRWLTLTQFGERVGISSPSTQVEWLLVDAALPLAPLHALPPYGAGTSAAHPTPWRRLVSLMALERHDIWAVVVYAVAVGLLGLTTPVAVQSLVNTVAFGTLLQPLVVLSTLLFAGLALSAILRALSTWVVEIIQQRIFVRAVGDLAHRLPRVRTEALDGRDGAELVNRFFDVFTIQKSAASLLLGGLEVVLTVGVGLLVLGFYHPILLALDALLVGIVLVILLGLGRRGVDSAIDESKRKYKVAAWLESVASAPTAFSMGGGPAHAWAKADALARGYLLARKAHFRVLFAQVGALLGLQALASAAVLGVGGWLVVTRQLTLGQLVAAELIVTIVVASLAKLGKYVESAYDLLAALDKVGQLADLPVRPSDGARPTGEGPATLELRRVDAGYGPSGPKVLAGLDLHIAPREHTALVGRAGSGKSLLLDVIGAIREPIHGAIRVDQAELLHTAGEELRRDIAFVRDAEIVEGSVLTNVAFGRPRIDAPRVWDAIDSVGLRETIELLDLGLDAPLCADGSPLSRSARVRLTLARAIAARPRLLVIDGALDTLDPEALAPVLDTIFSPDAPWTLIISSARPSVIQRARRCVCLEDGAVRDLDTHRATQGGE